MLNMGWLMKKTSMLLLCVALAVSSCCAVKGDRSLVALTAIQVDKLDASANIQIETTSNSQDKKEAVVDGESDNIKWVLSTDSKVSVVAKAGLSISSERHTLYVAPAFFQLLVQRPELFIVTIDSSTKKITIQTKEKSGA